MLGFSPTASAPTGANSPTVLPPPQDDDMTFTRSTVRTLTVSPGSRPFSGADLWDLVDPRKPRSSKDPDSTLDYSLNWAPWLADSADTIAAHEVILSGGLSLVSSFASASVVSAFVSGGTTGERASITFRITTASTPPRTDDRTIYLDIEAT